MHQATGWWLLRFRMRKLAYILYSWALVCVSLLGLVSCVGTAPGREVRLVDSLNQVSYEWRYRNLDSSQVAARRALQSVGLYSSGKAEAYNNLAFCAFMRMDFELAERYCLEVYEVTKNELELLIADIGLMKIYQRTALNMEYYNYRNSALRRMKRIAEDGNLFVDRHERRRLDYARSEFYIVSAVYYYYLQQQPEALACVNELSGDAALANDTSQLLYYHYIKGSAGLCGADTPEQEHLREFDELYQTWMRGRDKGYLYFEGNGLQGLANLMAAPGNYAFFVERRGHALGQLGVEPDSLLPLRLGQQALQCFRQYGDLYQIAGAYVSIGKYLNAHGHYREALDTLGRALECVNEHHRLYYDCHDSLDWLSSYKPQETDGSTEQRWMQQKLKTVPEWISRIREQLSVSYAGIGQKEPSDYNRNIYLDILEDTRQDKELESRFLALEKGEMQLNALLWLVVMGAVAVVLFFWLFNRRSRKRSVLHLRRLRLLLDICQKLTSSIPAEAQDEDEIRRAMCSAVAGDVEKLFGTSDFCIEGRSLVLPSVALHKDERAMLEVINPYVEWALDNGRTAISLGDERRRLEKQRYIYEQHIETNKRRNVEKKACLAIVNGIQPYIDRIINEVNKLLRREAKAGEEERHQRYEYMDELVTTINEYNEILALWIKMRQGILSLNIENFALDELFDLLRKGTRSFEMKQLRLDVVPSGGLCLKADKALTMFMLNTLAENARKYTPAGGWVKVYAQAGDGYVEISVEDNGRGLSPQDVELITEQKVYDPKAIGMADATDATELQKAKGSGFGLMNCKGIIDKYRKTNTLFSVCKFGVESTLGKGSRFYFRLPIGVTKTLVVLIGMLTMFAGIGCTDREMPGEASEMDTLTFSEADSLAIMEYEELLNRANDFANEAYFCNVDRDYQQALVCIDSAMYYLNEHYRCYSPVDGECLSMTGQGEPAEVGWWNQQFDTDYHAILDIRNEAAVAFLALRQWDAYSYNNAAYTTMYKLLSEDQTLEDFCRVLERSTNNKTVALLLAALLLVALVVGYYVLYFRKRLVNRWNLEQVLEINKQVYEASLLSADGEAPQSVMDRLEEMPQRIVDHALDAVNELMDIDGLCLMLHGEVLPYRLYTAGSYRDNSDNGWEELARRCYERQLVQEQDRFLALPLVVEAAGTSTCIGALCLHRGEQSGRDYDRLLLQLVARYMAIVVFNAVLRLSEKYRDIELAQDEARRASREDNLLHVQNLVLDNCLSTIKHETVYYPNRIKQLVARLRNGQNDWPAEAETVDAIRELIEYYKGIFTLLSSCATRQLDEVTFRRAAVAINDLTDASLRYFKKASRTAVPGITLVVSPLSGSVVGDGTLLRFLVEQLIDEALTVPLPGELRFKVTDAGDFLQFSFIDPRRNKSQEELNQLFYPSLGRMTGAERLSGTVYLICKQIIRDHDAAVGHRGCRINAEVLSGGGFVVYFTLPKVS